MRLALCGAVFGAFGSVCQPAAEGQEGTAPGAPAIDRTNPAEVARAYIEACQAGDAEAALLLLSPDDGAFRPAMVEVSSQLRGPPEGGLSFGRLVTESLCLPVGLEFAAEAPVVEQVGDGTARVAVRRTWNLQQQFVMERAEDGTWSIKALDSIRATTGSDSWFAGMGPRQASRSGSAWQSEARLRALAKAFHEYARHHGDRLPPKATWMDAIEPYVLDMQVFRSPAVPEQEYGYAMNALMDGAELPHDSGHRRNIALLFEWRGAERNASAPPEELGDMEPRWPDGSIILVDANGNPWHLPRGMTFGQFLLEEEHQRKCGANLRALARAARRYARANEGMLPGKDSWQDELALYLIQEPSLVDVFRCPVAEELDYAYAINSDVAGMDATELTGHDEIVLFFESDLNVANASGDPMRDAVSPTRHLDEWDTQRRNQVSYLSGLSGYHRPATE